MFRQEALTTRCLIGFALIAGALNAAEGDRVIDPKAAQVLERMGAYMHGLKQFTFMATNIHDVVMKGNQKITMFASSKVSVQRPNRVRSDRVGELAKLQFFYDGRTLTLYGQGENYYAQRDFGQNLDEAFEGRAPPWPDPVANTHKTVGAPRSFSG